MNKLARMTVVGIAIMAISAMSYGNIAYTVSNLNNVPGGPAGHGIGDLGVFFTEATGGGGQVLLNGVLTDLNTLLPAGSGWTDLELVSVDDVTKQIVGTGVLGGTTLPFLLTPAGDANGNGRVDSADLAVWQQNYSPTVKPGSGYWTGDWNGDGRVDGQDLAIWQRNYSPAGLSYELEMPPTEEPIHGPEPTTMILLALSVGLAGNKIRQAFKRG